MPKSLDHVPWVCLVRIWWVAYKVCFDLGVAIDVVSNKSANIEQVFGPEVE